MDMPDSVTVPNLPDGYPAYLGYMDGIYLTAGRLRARFTGKHILLLTVRGGSAVADGCDCEAGDLSPASAARWLNMRLKAGAWRPVVYCSVSVTGAVLAELRALGVTNRSWIRIITAHYGHGKHICGPRSCGQLPFDADGTQWTDQFPGVGGRDIDMSLLRDDFFGGSVTPAPPPVDTWQEAMMKKLPVLKNGMTGEDVRTAQGALCARSDVVPSAEVRIDGDFGPATEKAVKAVQAHYLSRAAADGVVGPKTWPVLLGV